MRRPETVAATAAVVGQPLGPLSRALPGRTRAGLTRICGLTACWAGGWSAGGWLVGGSSGGGGGCGVVLRVLVITHSHWSPLATWTLPSVSAGFAACALSTHDVVES